MVVGVLKLTSTVPLAGGENPGARRARARPVPSHDWVVGRRRSTTASPTALWICGFAAARYTSPHAVHGHGALQTARSAADSRAVRAPWSHAARRRGLQRELGGRDGHALLSGHGSAAGGITRPLDGPVEGPDRF